MLEQRIQQQFFESADLHNECAESLARQVLAASQALLNTFTGGCKLFVCGCGTAAAVAQHAQRVFVGRFERERPPLAAVLLSEPADFAAAQIAALAQPGDALLLLTDPAAGDAALASACLNAAHACEAHAVLIGTARGPASDPLLETDVHIVVPQVRAARVLELQLVALHAVCDALDTQLLGEQESQ